MQFEFENSIFFKVSFFPVYPFTLQVMFFLFLLWYAVQILCFRNPIICFSFMYKFQASYRLMYIDSKNNIVLNLNSGFDSRLFFHRGAHLSGVRSLVEQLKLMFKCIVVSMVSRQREGWWMNTTIPVLLRSFSLFILKER